MKIGTIATGAAVETTINLNYVPQYIYYVAATQLSSIRVTVEGDGTILDLDTTGLTAVGSITRFGTVANAYLIPLADGLVKNKVTQLTFTNSAAQTPDVFAFSMQDASVYVRSRQQLVLANSAQDITDFAYFAVNSPSVADIYTLEFSTGTTQRFAREDFQAMASLFQNDVTPYVVNNTQQQISVLNVNPSANRTVYVVDFQPIGDLL
jgi:hypothetical protein